MGVPAAVARAPAEVVHIPASVTGAREKMDLFQGPFVYPQLTNPIAAEGAPREHVFPLLTIPIAAGGAQSDHVMLESLAVELSYIAAPVDNKWSWQRWDG